MDAKKIWDWIDYNRFVVVGLVLAVALWVGGIACTPETISPLDPNRAVTARGLAVDFKVWQAEQVIIAAKFEAAGEDLAEQAENNKKLESIVLNLASGGVADLPGLLQLLVAGGGLGAIGDNIRKRAVISGLKRNKK